MKPGMPALPPLTPPHKPDRGRRPGFKRGDLVSCDGCGYVFVVPARTGVVCRRCGGQDLEPWKRDTSNGSKRRRLL